MKTTVTTNPPTPPPFAPVTIAITCETKKELDAIGAIFNSGWISTAFRVLCDARLPYEAIYSAGGSIDTAEITALLKSYIK